MSLDKPRVRELLNSGELTSLFIEELGWDRLASGFPVEVDGHVYSLEPVAEKRGVQILECPCDTIPAYALRQKIDRQARKLAHEHLLVFTDSAKTTQIWQWVSRQPAQPVAYREYTFYKDHSADALIQRLKGIAFPLSAEEGLDIMGVTKALKDSLDREKVTKKFYERFCEEHDAFKKFLTGIPLEADQRWYASVMLNRLMFIYFIQAKGYLNGDDNHLNNKLAESQKRGKDHFYREFLCPLFFKGFAEREHSEEIKDLLGDVPYLNGGIFLEHQLEKARGKNILIPDRAFQRLFAFFDRYRWHLDERPLRDQKEINPDILGYIFEKYINQKQMGAYYTKEDITEYISKNTIVPYLFDAAKSRCKIAFGGEHSIWNLLRVDPDRYIYPAILKGVGLPLPSDIAAGIDAISKRDCWKTSAPDEYALPTETWRAVVARRQRYKEIKGKLLAGEIHQINDLITYNLDIRQFAQDVIQFSEGPELLRAFWRAIEEITVLDPTCGSGAFLFAALNILEQLYEACLDRMQAFVDELDRSKQKHRPEKFSDFRKILARIDQHPNRRYFILKSIIVKNLYGVDIMEEAVEICKLRLFLKLVAQAEKDTSEENWGIEPLPDIDFNIRTGNTLVGYATLEEAKRVVTSKFDFDNAWLKIEQKAADLQQAFDEFRDRQLEGDGVAPQEDKQNLKLRLEAVSGELTRYLAKDYGKDPYRPREFEPWSHSHKPFHWFVEFYGIMNDGGFDVIIGNPPYIASSKVDYLPREMLALRYPDIYALVARRSLTLSNSFGRPAMIIPLSVTFSNSYSTLRRSLCGIGDAWYSSYDNIPASVFAGVSQRCTIWIGSKKGCECFASPMFRWRSVSRPHLMQCLTYFEVDQNRVTEMGLPKLSSPYATKVLAAIHATSNRSSRNVLVTRRELGSPLGFSQSARNFVSIFKSDPPCLSVDDLKNIPATKVGYVFCESECIASAGLASLAGELFFSYWLTRGDGFDVTSWIVKDYLSCLKQLPDHHFQLLSDLGEALHARRFEALVFKKNAGKFVGNINYRGHYPFTRRADLLVLGGSGVGKEEALSVFDCVQRVLAINEYAGEKGIPEQVKRKFMPEKKNKREQESLFQECDEVISRHYGFTKAELEFLVDHDVKWRAETHESNEDA